MSISTSWWLDFVNGWPRSRMKTMLWLFDMKMWKVDWDFAFLKNLLLLSCHQLLNTCVLLVWQSIDWNTNETKLYGGENLPTRWILYLSSSHLSQPNFCATHPNQFTMTVAMQTTVATTIIYPTLALHKRRTKERWSLHLYPLTGHSVDDGISWIHAAYHVGYSQDSDGEDYWKPQDDVEQIGKIVGIVGG